MSVNEVMGWTDSALDLPAYQGQTMDIVGYADQFSAEAGDRIRFMISARVPEYESQLVRLIHGDDNPDGPGFKEVELPAPCNSIRPGREQKYPRGSYVRVDDPSRKLACQTELVVDAWIMPTLLTPGPSGRLTGSGAQGLLTRWDAASRSGWAVVLDSDGAVCVWLGDRRRVASVSTGVGVRGFAWYAIRVSINCESGAISIAQKPARVYPEDPTFAVVTQQVDLIPASPDVPVLIAGWHDSSKPRWFDVVGHFTGKVDRPRVHCGGVCIADWDFSQEIGSSRVVDLSSNRLNGIAINMPMRGVTGHNFRGRETDFRRVPEEYGAIKFHADDLDDARWAVDFALDVGTEMKSGVYAVRLRSTSSDSEDYVPFFIRPRLAEATAAAAFLAPTYSYLAYGNEHISWRHIGPAVEHKASDYLQPQDYYVAQEELLSLYDHHRDGTGACYASRLRPLVVNFRPRYIAPQLLCSQEFNADLHLIDWLEAKKIDVDVITDEDLHRDGLARLRPYRAILTGTHPEYASEAMVEALEGYLDGGGRIMYLGGNGFYWPIGTHPQRPHIIEVRRGQNGTGTWRSAPGENHLSTTGEVGGLWRDRGRAPQRLVGVGMAGAGFDRGGWFERTAESFDPRVRFIFEGVSAESQIGKIGIGPGRTGGAVGIEIDRMDSQLGTPSHALVIATSKGLSRSFQRAVEEVEFTDDKQGAPDCPFVRADMVFFETPNGGAVFSVGSMTWSSCLSQNNYQNDVSRITENVLTAFINGDLPNE
jgi:N,N-dimethylformamidase